MTSDHQGKYNPLLRASRRVTGRAGIPESACRGGAAEPIPGDGALLRACRLSRRRRARRSC